MTIDPEILMLVKRCNQMTTEALADFVKTERDAGRIKASEVAWELYSMRPDYSAVSNARFKKWLDEHLKK